MDVFIILVIIFICNRNILYILYVFSILRLMLCIDFYISNIMKLIALITNYYI